MNPGAPTAASSPEANRILKLLPAEEYKLVAPHLETVGLARRQVLFGPDQPISHVYFPQTGVLSAISHLSGGRAVEVGTIGNEGMLGLPVSSRATACRSKRSPRSPV